MFVNKIQSQENARTHITTEKQPNTSSFTFELTVICSAIKTLHQFYSLFPFSRTILTMRRRNEILCLFCMGMLYIPKF